MSYFLIRHAASPIFRGLAIFLCSPAHLGNKDEYQLNCTIQKIHLNLFGTPLLSIFNEIVTLFREGHYNWANFEIAEILLGMIEITRLEE